MRTQKAHVALLLAAAACLLGSLALEGAIADTPVTGEVADESPGTAGYTPAERDRLHRSFALEGWDDGGELSRYVYLHDGREVRFAEHVRDSGIDGIVIVHRGRIVYEDYPRMRPHDKHLAFSVTKAFVVSSGMEGTEWRGAPFRDPAHKHYQLEASLGWLPAPDDLPRAALDGNPYEVLAGLERAAEPGRRFEYLSANTAVLGWLVERVTGKNLAEALATEIWTRIGAEADAQMVVTATAWPSLTAA